MWSNNEKGLSGRPFSTPPPPPPATWRSSMQHSPLAMKTPMSESRKSLVSPGCRRDLFHVIHKVPPGDSPYVRAKHVQLIEKDPSKAVSMFWAAINAGDRVDSALKDMAVVMKQLNRADEAIEAIKSFRHLCPNDSQESLDNLLVELYKRSGRIEEEIEMLQRRLKNIEEGIAFGGKRTKTARSQGKKIQITAEQERSRILGNLAWAYLQQHNYGLAEQHYRKALSLEADKNKQCNLAICLMHMNRFPEAKSLLQAVESSCGSKPMDESYAKSFERAVQMLTELESQSKSNPTEQDSSSVHKNMFPSPAPVLYTQPRKCLRGFEKEDEKRTGWPKDKVEKPSQNMPRGTIWNLSGELLESTESETTLQNSQCSLSSDTDGDWRERAWRDVAKLEPLSQPTMNGDECINKNDAVKSFHKSWADIVEEDEQELIARKDLGQCFEGWNGDEESNDENLNYNIIHQDSCLQSPLEPLGQKLEALDLKDVSGTSRSAFSSRNLTVRRSLCFEAGKDKNTKRKNRLQVFRDITPSPDSP